MLHEVERSLIWGLTSNGITYVFYREMFIPLITVGEICYFVAEIFNNAYRYDSRPIPAGFNYSEALFYPPIIRDPDIPYSITYDPYAKSNREYIPFEYNKRMYEISERNLRQYLIDFEDGKVIECNIKNAGLLLQQDSALSVKFRQLPRKKKKELIVYYISKYNENNPLYIPESKSE